MDTEPLDPEVVGALSAELGEPAVFARLVRLYLERLDDRLDATINAEDPEALAAAAHSLKSSSGTFGATRVAEIASRLEELGNAGEDAPPPLLDELLNESERARVALERVVAEADAAAEGDASGAAS